MASSCFDGVPLLQRHRMVNDALAEELAAGGGVHALVVRPFHIPQH